MAETALRTFNPEQGLFELTLMNGEISSSRFDDFVIDGINMGIPSEIMMRLKALWEKTKVVAGEVIAIGRIIVQQIFNFLKANPKLTIGLAIGAAVAALVAGIPILGPILAPVSTAISTLYGAGVGAAMGEGDYSGSPYTAAITLAHKFFELLQSILIAVSEYWTQS
ncbi:MAG: hypothetical protein KDG55_00530 [Rhodocyclaceae bacterium]|nr:hypothetical protein [Rhodocyclaceae bacterium]